MLYKQNVESYLPLKPVILHILLELAQNDMHGYGIMQAVRDGSDGTIRIETGPLYRHLHRLVGDGLVADAKRRGRTALEDPRRKTYRLTPLGRRVVAAETGRLAALVARTRRLNLFAPHPA